MEEDFLWGSSWWGPSEAEGMDPCRSHLPEAFEPSSPNEEIGSCHGIFYKVKIKWNFKGP